MVLHTLEDNQAIAWRFNAVVLHVELRTDTVSLYLVLDQKLCGLLEALENLTDADCPTPRHPQVIFNNELSKEMRLARAAAPVGALIPGRGQQREEHFRRLDCQV